MSFMRNLKLSAVKFAQRPAYFGLLLSLVASALLWSSSFKNPLAAMTTNLQSAAPATLAADNPDPAQPVPAFVAREIPLAIEGAVVGKPDGVPMILFSATNKGSATIQELQVFVLEFTPTKDLLNITSQTLPAALSPSEKQQLFVKLERPPAPENKFALTVGAIADETEVRELEGLALLKHVDALFSQKQSSEPALKLTNKHNPNGRGDFCHRIASLANNVLPQGKRLQVAGLTCNQTDRSFSFGFSAVVDEGKKP